MWLIKQKKNRKLYTKSGLKIKTENNEEEEEDDEIDENAVPLPPVEKTSDGKYAFGRLDASVIDVYKGTNAVVIMMDPIKPWTFDYVKKEMKKIPQTIHTLLIVNFKDEISKRLVSEREIKEYVATIERDNFYYIEASMKDCFGLRPVYTFLNLPFLQIQKNTILERLKRSEEEFVTAKDELRILTEKADYKKYLEELKSSKIAKKEEKKKLKKPR